MKTAWKAFSSTFITVALAASALALTASEASAAPATWTDRSTGFGASGAVQSLLAIDPTTVYAAGTGRAGGNGTPYQALKIWNGSAWSAPAGSPSSNFFLAGSAVAKAGSTIYLGGDFGPLGAGYVNRWPGTGSSWPLLSGGVTGNVNAIAVDAAGKVYVGGEFTNALDASNTPVSGTSKIAMWDPATDTWSALGRGVNNDVYSIAVATDGKVYVGGLFTSALDGSGSSVTGTSKIAMWDPVASTWSAMGRGANGDVNSVTADASGGIYIGGNFTQTNDATNTPVPSTTYIAKWDGSAWSDVGGGLASAPTRVTDVLWNANRVFVLNYASNYVRVYANGGWTLLPSAGMDLESISIDSSDTVWVGAVSGSPRVKSLSLPSVPMITSITPALSAPVGGGTVTIAG